MSGCGRTLAGTARPRAAARIELSEWRSLGEQLAKMWGVATLSHNLPMHSSVVLSSVALAGLLAACARMPDAAAPLLATPVAIETTMHDAMAEVHANGMAIAVIDFGQVVYSQAFGHRNKAGDLLRSDTVMVAASLTKPVFAYLVMQLADEGRIDLDAPIARYLTQPLPSYAAWSSLAGDERWRAITPRMLLSHRSGLPNLPALEQDGKVHLHFNSGTRFAYSGAGINLLQFVLESGLGLDVQAELRRRVFQRFDMRHTSMTWQPDAADNQADGYTSNGKSRPHPHRTRAAAASSMARRSRTMHDSSRAWCAATVCRLRRAPP